MFISVIVAQVYLLQRSSYLQESDGISENENVFKNAALVFSMSGLSSSPQQNENGWYDFHEISFNLFRFAEALQFLPKGECKIYMKTGIGSAHAWSETSG